MFIRGMFIMGMNNINSLSRRKWIVNTISYLQYSSESHAGKAEVILPALSAFLCIRLPERSHHSLLSGSLFIKIRQKCLPFSSVIQIGSTMDWIKVFSIFCWAVSAYFLKESSRSLVFSILRTAYRRFWRPPSKFQGNFSILDNSIVKSCISFSIKRRGFSSASRIF